MKQPRMKPLPARSPAVILWRGKSCSLAEAGVLAIREHQLGNLPAVADIYSLMLAKVPNAAELHNNLGAVLQTLQRYEEALASYDQAIALKPGYANAHHNRGSVLKKLNRHAEALASYDRAVALKPDHAEAHNNRGVLLQELKRYDEALASFERAIAAKPDHAEAHNNCGVVLVNKGNMPAAEKMFLKAFELKPDFPDPVFNLAHIRKYQDADNADVKSIHALLNRPGVSPDSQEHLYFTLGKIYDDCSRYEEAFDCFQRANQIRNRRVAYDAGLVTRMTDGLIEVFSKDFLARPFSFASESPSPLFIVGMPRSGTTLLASILSNHPAVAMAGELTTLADLTLHLPEWTGTGVLYPQAAKHIASTVAARVTADYEKRLRRDAGPEVRHVIDKNPLNFRHLGLITMLFPQARIIHCTRDPLDTCLSNYFQRFPLFMDYSFDLRNIGHFYTEYARLMAHWRTLPNLNWIEISYEEMILSTETTARRALDFLGLAWDDRCLAPHTNPYAVETASHWQVRQPIYRHSVQRWRHYEKHLAPLKEELLAAGQISG